MASREAMAWRFAAAPLLGATLHVCCNAVAIFATVPWPDGGLTVRIGHHAADAGLTWALSCITGIVTLAVIWLCRFRMRLAFGFYLVASSLAMGRLLWQTLERQANAALNGTASNLLFALFLTAVIVAVPTAHVLADILARRRWLWLVPLVVGVGAMVANHLFLRDDYEVVHTALGWGAIIVFGAAVAPRPVEAARRLAEVRPTLVRGSVAAALTASLVALALPPPNAVRLELFKEPGAIAAWVMANTAWSVPEISAAPPDSPWFSSRVGLPPVPPTSPPGPDAPIVVLVTIDALRAEVLEGTHNDERLRTMAAMKRTGTTFEVARSPGAQTSVSLSAMFAGKYFSGLRWAPFGEGSTRFLYPNQDSTPRFPELLRAAGVRTVSVVGVNFLADPFGISRGFSEQHVIPKGRQHAVGREVVDPIVELLRDPGRGPLFVFAHLMEPHAPYDRGEVRDGPLYERYLSEIEVADREIARLSRLLFSGPLRDRSYLFVASDHGEAFGEHGTWRHTKTLYEELLRVPLLVRGPDVAHQSVDQPVTLVDLGPTILDLFGVPTPPHFMGQSLVPLLRGGDVTLTRPIVAEGRLRRAIVDGRIKVIVDERRKVVEAYDLEVDPDERHNLYDANEERVREELGRLVAFFDAHQVDDDDYEVPYKP